MGSDMVGPALFLFIALLGSAIEATRGWVSLVGLPLGLAVGFFYLNLAGKAWAGLLAGLIAWGLAGLTQLFPIPALENWPVDHGLMLLGNVLMVVGLYRLEGYQPPRLSLGLLVPFMAFFVLSFSAMPLWLWLAYTASGMVLMHALGGQLERYLKGHSPDERALWGAGLLLYWCAGLWQLAPGAEGLRESPLPGALSGLALWLLGWGAWLEATAQRKPWSEALTFVTLMLGWITATLATEGGWANSVATGGVLLLGGLGLLYSNLVRRHQAEARTQDWVRLLESLYHVTPVNQTISPNAVLKEIMEPLKPLFPTLTGIALHGDQSTIVGKKTVYDHVIPLEENGDVTLWLYFERRPAMMNELTRIEPLLIKRLRQILVVRELRSQVFSDPLTGLLNRRGMEQQLPRVIELAQRNRQAITVAMLDMDHFKRINDTYGHPVGDVALRTMAEVLRSHVRTGDLAVRWGGEEFALVLSGIQISETQAVLERIQSEMRGRKVASIAWPITLSGGVCGGQVPTGKNDLEDWFHQADIALLRAKETGRNRVEVAKRK
jgi:diguanylate cyclase (GGDEF)-like protein